MKQKYDECDLNSQEGGGRKSCKFLVVIYKQMKTAVEWTYIKQGHICYIKQELSLRPLICVGLSLLTIAVGKVGGGKHL